MIPQPFSILLEIHIFGAVIGILSGTLAMIFRKGRGLHGAAGTVFLSSMCAMSLSAVYLAVFHKYEPANVVAGLLTFYLVLTSWRAARNRRGTTNAFDIGALVLILTLSVAAFAVAALQTVAALRVVMFVFGGVAMLFAAGDIRMIRSGGLAGPKRIIRHLLRMSLAFLIAVLSFYPARARFFPAAWNRSGVLYLPHILLVISIVVWILRLSRKPRQATSLEMIPNAQVTS